MKNKAQNICLVLAVIGILRVGVSMGMSISDHPNYQELGAELVRGVTAIAMGWWGYIE